MCVYQCMCSSSSIEATKQTDGCHAIARTIHACIRPCPCRPRPQLGAGGWGPVDPVPCRLAPTRKGVYHLHGRGRRIPWLPQLSHHIKVINQSAIVHDPFTQLAYCSERSRSPAHRPPEYWELLLLLLLHKHFIIYIYQQTTSSSCGTIYRHCMYVLCSSSCGTTHLQQWSTYCQQYCREATIMCCLQPSIP